jgi:membrane fusion protein (multidrug efflux system)
MTKELEAPELEQEQAHAPKPPRARVEAAEEEVAAPPKRKLSRWLALLAAAAVAAGVAAWWSASLHYETTDDAQVEGHLDLISSRVSGTVTFINPKVENNQFVEAGTLLAELDPRDYQAELERAKADLDTRNAEARSARVTIPIVDATASSQLRAAEAQKEQANSQVSAAEADLTAAQHKLQQDRDVAARAERDRVRYAALVEKREISRSDYDARETESATAAQAVQADLAVIQSSEQRIAQARSLVDQRQAQIEGARTAPQQVTNAQDQSLSAVGHVEQASAEVHTAQLNLSYTKIYAPVSGVIGRKTVELGQRIQPGQSLLVIVPLDDIWITANFKETQMKNMRAGEPVRIHVDSADRDFNGTIENLPGAAGPLFSLFPPENATGNYVKVVQRFPVRIRLNQGEDPQHLLRPGMSVEPRVTVR